MDVINVSSDVFVALLVKKVLKILMVKMTLILVFKFYCLNIVFMVESLRCTI